MIKTILDWFCGGAAESHSRYMKIHDCMAHDDVWVGLFMGFAFSIAVGYGVIAYYWFVNQRTTNDSLTKRLLNRLMWIFLFCGITGYGMPIMMYFWPGYRLRVILLGILMTITWSFVTKIARVRIDFTTIKLTPKEISDI